MALTPEWSKLGSLLFVAKQLAHGLYPGMHPSSRRGAGLEFHDYRPYSPGDDPAGIDWKLFGRTDRLYLRRYRQWTDLNVYLMIDHTASMDFPLAKSTTTTGDPDTPTKLGYARLLAATIAYLAIRQGDRVALGFMTDRLTRYLPPAGGSAALENLCWALERLEPAHGKGNLAAAIAHAQAVTQRRGLFVILSDLLDEPAPFFDALNRLRHHRHDTAVFQVLSPQELDPAKLPTAAIRLRDPETQRTVTTDIPEIHSRYAKLLSDHLQTIRHGCLARGADHHRVTTDQPIVAALRDHLTRRAQPGRSVAGSLPR